MAIPGGDTALQGAVDKNTRGAFAEALLEGIGAPVSSSNMQAMMAWMTGENTKAAFNPLATTRMGPVAEGSTQFNSHNVRNYKSFDQGVAATLETLNLGYYTDIVAALRRGSNPQELQQLVAASPWGTKSFGKGDLSLQTTALGTQADASIYYSDPITSQDTGAGIGAYETQQDMDDAWELAQDMLADYGLESLFDEVYELVTTGRTPEMAMKLIRDSEAYQTRFKGMADRVANGYAPITPARYVELENNYRSMMSQAGFDPEFIGDDFSEFIANDVNESEFGDRIDVALQAVDAADPLVLEELKDRYGIGVDSKADLVMYFLDPERAVNLLEARTQLGVARLSAATTGTIGGRLETKTAEKLFQRGYSEREVAERLKGRGAFRQRLIGEQKRTKTGGPLSSTELAAAEFGLDSEAVAMVKNLTAQRRQRGVSTAGAAMTSGGVMGFGRAT